MALFRKLFYRKPPDGLLEISERVFVFDCCFTTDCWGQENYKPYVGGIIGQLRDIYPDASILVFNFRESNTPSAIGNILSEYDITIMDYPRNYEGCPLLSMEVLHHFLRSSESWLALGQQNVLLMHCELGGWPVLAFTLASLLIFRKHYTVEQKTLDVVYRQAPHELLYMLSPLNPIPSQLRYLQYISRRNVASEWPPLDRALTLDCLIIRMIPNFDGKGGCRPIFRIYGQDPFLAADRTSKVLFSTPKRSKTVRNYKQGECELVKIDINCHIQGDIVIECISLHDDLEGEVMMFRVMFNTAFIRSNILMLNRDEIDILWDAKDHFAKDFRAEVLFSDMDSAASVAPINLSCFEEKDGLPVEAFAKVQEIFSSVDWVAPNADATLNVLQNIAASNIDSPKNIYANILSHDFDLEKNLETRRFTMLESDIQSSLHVALEKKSMLSPKQSPNIEASEQKVIAQLQTPTRDSISPTTPTPLPPSRPSTIPSPTASLSSLSPTCLVPTPGDNLASQTEIFLSPPPPTKSDPPILPSATGSRKPPSPPPPPSTLPLKCNMAVGVELPQPPLTPTPSSRPTSSPPAPPLKDNSATGIRPLLPQSSPPTFSPPTQPLKHTSDARIEALATILPPPSPPPLPSTHLQPPDDSAVRVGPSAPPPTLPTSALPSTSPLCEKSEIKMGPLGIPPTPALKDSPAFDVRPPPSPPPPPPPPPMRAAGSTIAAPVHPPPPPPLFSSSFTHLDAASKDSSHVNSVPPPPVSYVPPPPVPSLPPPPVTPVSLQPISSGNSGGGTICAAPSPPPPFISPSGGRGRALQNSLAPRNNQTKKLKPLHWLKLTRAVQGSLWAETQKSDKASMAPEIDISELESLFSAAVPNTEQGSLGKKSNSRAGLGHKFEKVQLIEHRRAYNCEIMLSKVKIPLPDLMSSVLALEDSAIDVDQVDNLIKFCPTKEEMELLKGYKGEKDKLGRCEQFFLELMKVPRIESKLRVFSFKIQFHSQVSDLRKCLCVVNSAAEEIRNSAKLKRIMQTILSLGNALNQGTARGSAVGFRLDSLLKLTETRARNNKMTLMNYLCKVLDDKLPELLDFSKDLASLEPASKIHIKFLAEEMQAISKGLEKVVQELSMSENDGLVSEKFCKALKEFLCCAEGEVRLLASLYSGVGRNVDALIIYFGEDPSRCTFEQVVSTLLNFVRMFNRAKDENCKQLEFERRKAEKEAGEKPKINVTDDTERLKPAPVKAIK